MKTAREFFPEIMCGACGRHGLTSDEARLHFDCRDVPDNVKELKCAMCGEKFYDLMFPKKDEHVDPKYARKRHWKGRQIYAHKRKHVDKRDVIE